MRPIACVLGLHEWNFKVLHDCWRCGRCGWVRGWTGRARAWAKEQGPAPSSDPVGEGDKRG